ncbi:MAG: hypothetical protein N3B10_04460 [Armatimonadetes bacterium]|nr:hypothetical protein [Armatimonadota bacterium]MCX7967730.1 hypothetical protein [Armatimonadota bacterium]MDW8142750.1 hypothetical protein [Armatimonadota bacterium]
MKASGQGGTEEMSSVADKRCSDVKENLCGVVFRSAFYFAFYFWRR